MERSAEQESNPTTPGMKYRHYSPTAKVVMLLPAGLVAKAINRSGERMEREEGIASTSAKVVESLLAKEGAEETRPQVGSGVDVPLEGGLPTRHDRQKQVSGA